MEALLPPGRSELHMRAALDSQDDFMFFVVVFFLLFFSVFLDFPPSNVRVFVVIHLHP